MQTTSTDVRPNDFLVVGAAAIRAAIATDRHGVLRAVEDAYRRHHAGLSAPPQSHFLRFPRRPGTRIIALPAHLDGDREAVGIKWISSFPTNVGAGIPRASAVIILNDPETGYPTACLEGALISAARTGASAALAARALMRGRAPETLGIIGCGPIAETTLGFLDALGWEPPAVLVHDLDAARAASFLARNGIAAGERRTGRVVGKEEVLRRSDLIILATTAPSPHIEDPALFAHGPVILNVSLRDLAPEVIQGADNYCDDVEHCLQAQTSLHLAAEALGGTPFIKGHIGDLLDGRFPEPAPGTPMIFSPFGLGVLDMAVAAHILDRLGDGPEVLRLPDFFGLRPA